MTGDLILIFAPVLVFLAFCAVFCGMVHGDTRPASQAPQQGCHVTPAPFPSSALPAAAEALTAGRVSDKAWAEYLSAHGLTGSAPDPVLPQSPAEGDQ